MEIHAFGLSASRGIEVCARLAAALSMPCNMTVVWVACPPLWYALSLPAPMWCGVAMRGVAMREELKALLKKLVDAKKARERLSELGARSGARRGGEETDARGDAG